jgi:hypothetical protein
MVDIDETLAMEDARTDFAQALKTGGVGGNDAIKLQPRFRFLDDVVRVEKLVFLRDTIFVPADNFLAFVLQRESQSELGADAIAVGPDMAHNAKGFALPNILKDSVYNLRVGFHFPARLLSRARIGFLDFVDDLKDAVTSNDRIVDDKLESWCVFEHNGAADEALDALAMAGEHVEPALLLLGIAQDTDEDHRRMQVAGNVNVVDSYQTGLTHRNFTANDFANLPFQEFTHPLESKRGHTRESQVIQISGPAGQGRGRLGAEAAHNF